MRRLLALASAAGLLAAATGCTGRTAPLTIRDVLELDAGETTSDGSVSVDAGFPIDATVPPPPPFDGGTPPADAGVFDSGTNACEIGPFSTDLIIEASPRSFRTFSGPALVEQVEPNLVLQFPRGPSVAVFTRAPLPDLVREGGVLWVDYGIERSVRLNAALALREFEDDGEPGDLRMLVFSLEPEAEPFDLDDIDVELEYLPSECEPGDIDGCGLGATLDLVYRDRRTEVRIPAGTERAVGDVRLGNGRTFIYLDEPRCMDTPRGWFDGYVTVR